MVGYRDFRALIKTPILPPTGENERGVVRAGGNCSLSGALVGRVKPLRSLEGMFFDWPRVVVMCGSQWSSEGKRLHKGNICVKGRPLGGDTYVWS